MSFHLKELLEFRDCFKVHGSYFRITEEKLLKLFLKKKKKNAFFKTGTYIEPVSFDSAWLNHSATGENEFPVLQMMLET